MSPLSMNLAKAAGAVGWDNALEVSPFTGNQRLVRPHNDVLGVIEVLGGVEAGAELLGVEVIEVHHWIDDHYVPTRYLDRLSKLTGYSGWSVQKPPWDVHAAVTGR